MCESYAIRNGDDHHTCRAALYNLWNMVPWFIIKQMRTEMAKLITYQPPYSLVGEWFYGSQSIKQMRIETETISDSSRKCFLMFPWSKMSSTNNA